MTDNPHNRQSIHKFWAFHEISFTQRGTLCWRIDRSALSLGVLR